jgi:hypothetical protein
MIPFDNSEFHFEQKLDKLNIYITLVYMKSITLSDINRIVSENTCCCFCIPDYSVFRQGVSI